jgi:hypothetical protein
LTPEQQSLLKRLVDAPEEVYASVAEKLRFWTARKVYLETSNRHYRNQLTEVEQGTLGKLDLFLLEEMLISAGHVDKDYVSDLAKGFPVTGSLFDGNLGEPIVGGQRVHNTPGLGGPEPIEELAAQCKQIKYGYIGICSAQASDYRRGNQTCPGGLAENAEGYQ